MKAFMLFAALVASHGAFATVDFYQCDAIANQYAEPQDKIRITVNEERRVFVAVGKTIVIAAQGLGQGDDNLNLELNSNDGKVLGTLKAEVLEGTVYMAGTIVAEGVSANRPVAITCIHHN